ncbi:MAG TPA: GNAT family N-acetyltransferase [Gemmatimonadaceae bacterium]|nr:GNAT family N-acetyltransferase [Gemmatimonadaceae bacterium]
MASRVDTATPRYTIALARPQDLDTLPSIELAALTLFDGHGLDDVPALVTGEAELRKAQEMGHLWVALANDVAVGFAQIKVIEANTVHLDELDVHPEHGRRGLGRMLVMAVCDWAEAKGYEAITLTTFRKIPWNMPLYASLGFTVVPPEALTLALASIVHEEGRRGLDPALRVVMRRALDARLSRAG